MNEYGSAAGSAATSFRTAQAPQVMSSCEEGFCGTCETRVLEGVPEHHDTLLSERERERGKTMMICVGRSKTPRLVLDL